MERPDLGHENDAELVVELVAALLRLCKSFPTDTDMLAAGWEPLEIEEACAAYDVARAALSKAGA